MRHFPGDMEELHNMSLCAVYRTCTAKWAQGKPRVQEAVCHFQREWSIVGIDLKGMVAKWHATKPFLFPLHAILYGNHETRDSWGEDLKQWLFVVNEAGGLRWKANSQVRKHLGIPGLLKIGRLLTRRWLVTRISTLAFVLFRNMLHVSWVHAGIQNNGSRACTFCIHSAYFCII